MFSGLFPPPFPNRHHVVRLHAPQAVSFRVPTPSFPPPRPLRDGLFIMYVSLQYRTKTIFPLFFFSSFSTLQFCKRQYRRIKVANVCKLEHDFFTLPVLRHPPPHAFRQIRDFISSTAGTDDSSENYDSE